MQGRIEREGRGSRLVAQVYQLREKDYLAERAACENVLSLQEQRQARVEQIWQWSIELIHDYAREQKVVARVAIEELLGTADILPAHRIGLAIAIEQKMAEAEAIIERRRGAARGLLEEVLAEYPSAQQSVIQAFFHKIIARKAKFPEDYDTFSRAVRARLNQFTQEREIELDAWSAAFAEAFPEGQQDFVRGLIAAHRERQSILLMDTNQLGQLVREAVRQGLKERSLLVRDRYAPFSEFDHLPPEQVLAVCQLLIADFRIAFPSRAAFVGLLTEWLTPDIPVERSVVFTFEEGALPPQPVRSGWVQRLRERFA